MIREMKLGVFLEPQELVRMASEDDELVLNVEDADVIKISSAPTALKEAQDALPEGEDSDEVRTDGGVPDSEVEVTTVDCVECDHPMAPFNPIAHAHICRECLEDIQIGDRFLEGEVRGNGGGE